jgi:hypothetical protein
VYLGLNLLPFFPGPNLPTAFIFPGSNLPRKGYLGPNLPTPNRTELLRRRYRTVNTEIVTVFFFFCPTSLIQSALRF